MALGRLGQIGTTGGTWATDNALFLKVFSGEVLTAYKRNCIFKDFVQTRSISSGKSAQFPVTGRFSADYHTPGTLLAGPTAGNLHQNEVVIMIDDLLVSHAQIADIDDMKTHYDIKSIYSTEMGLALARQVDRRLAREVILGARQASSDLAAATPTGLDAQQSRVGSRIDLAAATPTPDQLVTAVFEAARLLDSKDVAPDNRVLVCRPNEYYALIQSSRAVNMDFNSGGGNGTYADGRIAKLAGFSIYSSNHLAQGNVTAPALEAGKEFNGSVVKSTVDTTQTRMVAFQRGAVGMVNLKNLTMQKTGNDYKTMYQADLLVASMAYGASFLRPEACVEVHNSL